MKLKGIEEASLEDIDDDYDDDDSVTGTGSSSKPSSREEQILAKRETLTVRRLRLLTFLVLIVVATLASVGVYLYTQSDEVTGFHAEFASHGDKVITAFQTDSYRKLQALHSLSSSLTAYGLDHNESWPYVTVKNSAQIFGPYLSLADAAAIILLPIVPKDQRDKWESYSVENQDWIDEDLLAGELVSNATSRDLQGTEGRISPYIRNYVGIDTSPGDWIVWWQYAPVIPNRWFVNFNRLAWKGFNKEAELLMGEQEAVLSEAWTFEPGLDFQSTRDFTFTSELLEAGGNDYYEPGEPLGYIYYPVFEHFGAGAKTVSILSATVYWKTYFQGILTDNVKGVICVVKNSVGQAFTYKIDGKQATFLGMDDLHEPVYDDMVVEADYSSFSDVAAEELGAYKGVAVDSDHLSYRIFVYPSVEFQAQYITSNPAIYTVAMVVIFLLTAGIFLTYDIFVERRQKIVLSSAVRSNAVVKSLFPENVRHRLMEEATPDNKKKSASKEVQSLMDIDRDKASSSRPIAGKLARPPVAVTNSRGFSHVRVITDFFPEATVMFADIRGTFDNGQLLVAPMIRLTVPPLDRLHCVVLDARASSSLFVTRVYLQCL